MLAGVPPGAGFVASGFPFGTPVPVLPIPVPDAAAPPPIGCISGVAGAVAALCETPIACTVTFTGISSPFFKMALSNAIPIDDEESRLERAEACVTPFEFRTSRNYDSPILLGVLRHVCFDCFALLCFLCV